MKRLIEKTFLKYIDIVIANSKYLQDSIKDIYNIDSKILYPILDNKFLDYNSENKNKSQTSHLSTGFTHKGINSLPLSGERGYNETKKIIFSYGRWVFGKNIELVFDTYDNLKNEIRELVLII
ncbi:MAG: hypothetical protein Q8S84_07875 [bacterium]|nr:hypothetical protein [bacterium]